MAKRAVALAINESDRQTVERWVRARTTPRRLHLRARIVLLAAQGVPPGQIAQRLETTRPTVLLWRKRFQAGGLAAVQKDAPGRGRRRSIPTARVQAIVQATTQTTPKGATHWSTRTMAEAFGVSNATVARIWQAHGLQPHRVRPFKVSRDQRFAEKLTDVVGLCTCTRPTRPWSSASTRRARSRPWTAPSRASRSRRAAVGR
jgi:transposase